jgi:hypothetical protein
MKNNMTDEPRNPTESIQWTDALTSERELLIAIKRLFNRHPDLLTFVFDRQLPRLRCEPDILIQQSQSMSSGEATLTRIAMDLWNSSGNVRLPDIMERLDPGNFENVIATLRYLGPKKSISSRQVDPAWDRSLF